MFAPCPHCGFLVALIVTDGAPPHCPRCEQRLDSRSIAGTVPSARARELPVVELPVEKSRPVGDVVATASHAGGHRSGPADARLTPSAPAPHAPTVVRPPTFLRRLGAPARVGGRRWPGVLGASLLGALLVLQLALAQRAELAASERWRPLITTVCGVLGCDLPPWHEATAYTMLARDVQPASGQPGVLQVRASFRNDARWPQPWPVLKLQLTDVNGRAVAARQLQPADYHRAEAPPTVPLAPGQTASVDFRVLEPATPIVAFDFDFR